MLASITQTRAMNLSLLSPLHLMVAVRRRGPLRHQARHLFPCTLLFFLVHVTCLSTWMIRVFPKLHKPLHWLSLWRPHLLPHMDRASLNYILPVRHLLQRRITFPDRVHSEALTGIFFPASTCFSPKAAHGSKMSPRRCYLSNQAQKLLENARSMRPPRMLNVN